MTPAEQARNQEKAAARAAVVARMADGTVMLEAADTKHMTDDEVAEYARVGRFAGIPADKRLSR